MQHDRDDPRTQVGNGGGPALPPGHVLQEFVIEDVLGVGGFGIVYRARDTRLQRSVALKEYMPATMAARGPGHVVVALSQRERETFDTGLRSFVNEAQLLASFDHPSLVKVHRFWEQNGTAYMVMPLYQGATLKAWLKSRAVQPGQEWLLGLLGPLTDALEQLHSAQPCCLHRDVAPDNILLLQASASDRAAALPVHPLLLDFGAARRVIGDMTHTLTVFLKPGYAPIEQYGDALSMKQGPWTDVYALSAVLYACITGRAPVASVDRILADDLVPAVRAGVDRYTPGFLAAIDAGLKVRPEERPQSMREFYQLFAEPRGAPWRGDLPGEATRPLAKATDLGVLTHLMRQRKRRIPTAAAVIAALLVVGGGASWWFWLRGAWPDASGPVRVDAGAGPVRSEAPATVASGVVDESKQPAAAAQGAFSVMAVLQDIVDRADPQIRVTVAADSPVLTIGRDSLRFRVRTSEAGRVYVFSGGTDKRHFHLLFPNRLDKANRIEAGGEMVLPRKSWQISAEGPAGTNHLAVLVSRHERDLSRAGLRQTDEPIPEFDLAQAERLWSQRAPGANPYVGVPTCAPGCADAFGAALLAVQEVPAGEPRR